jgi:proteasome lid subunit RPN8/RPN11
MGKMPYDDIMKWCRATPTEETCGLIIERQGESVFIPCPNVAENKQEYFAIHPLDWAEAEDHGKVAAVVHCHINNRLEFSGADITQQAYSGIPWLLVTLDGRMSWLNQPKKEYPLYGRPFQWHVYDCYSFIRDFYEQELNIEIPDFYREENFWERGQELYLDNFHKAGFVEIPLAHVEYGDVLLIDLANGITSHGAVYLGANTIGHHPQGHISRKAVYGSYYIQRTTKALRHKDRMK